MLAKGLSIVILFSVTLLPAAMAITLFHRGYLSATGSPRRRLVLELLTCFSGGVFLSTCLLHLFVEGREELEAYKKMVGL
jgi:zinc transporter 1/2/3